MEALYTERPGCPKRDVPAAVFLAIYGVKVVMGEKPRSVPRQINPES